MEQKQIAETHKVSTGDGCPVPTMASLLFIVIKLIGVASIIKGAWYMVNQILEIMFNIRISITAKVGIIASLPFRQSLLMRAVKFGRKGNYAIIPL